MIKSSLRSLQLVDRTAYLLEACRGRRVLHLGATDAPETEAAIREGRFLHGELQSVAALLVGMDNNHAMIDYLQREQGVTDIRFGDIEVTSDYPDEAFEIVVAGEILEHLSNPGRALDALWERLGKGAVLIVTVPNAYSLKGFLRAVAGHEWIHPDHVMHQSLYTLHSLMGRHGFEVQRAFAFVNGGSSFLARLTNIGLKMFPQLAEGIGVVCRPIKSDKAHSGTT